MKNKQTFFDEMKENETQQSIKIDDLKTFRSQDRG